MKENVLEMLHKTKIVNSIAYSTWKYYNNYNIFCLICVQEYDLLIMHCITKTV